MATTQETKNETREQSLARIAAIPIDELLVDFHAASKDLQAAEIAVGSGRHEYQYRIVGNIKQIQVMQAEIKRRVQAHDDLLAALNELLPEGEAWRDGTMDHMPGVRKARLAIQKATGAP